MTFTPPQLPEDHEPPTQSEIAFWRAAADAQNAHIEAKEQAQSERQASLALPLAPLTIEGSTVSEVKASADAAIANLAAQMQERLNILNVIQ